MKNILFLLLLSILLVSGIHAQPIEDELPQITRCIALTNAKVIAAAGEEPVVQNVILRNGLITAIGPQAKIPGDAYKIAADSLYVYPAFIDAFSYTGIKEPEGGGRGQGPNRDERTPVDEEGNASLEDAGITPFKNTRATFDPKEKAIADWRAQGFAIAHVVPRGRMIPGQGAIVILSGKEIDKMIWKENVSYFGQWAGAGDSYPSTVIGIMAKWRELYHNSSQEIAHLAAYNANPMISRPQYNQAHEALMPLVKKEKPLYFKASNMKDIYRALALQKDLGMRMIIADAQEAYYLKNQFRTNGIPLVLSLDLPDDKTETETKAKAEAEAKGNEKVKEEGKEKTDSTIVKSDSIKMDPEKASFEKKRAESLKQHREQAGVLAKEGVAFSFGTMSGKAGDFSKTMQIMIENGLDKNTALSALTIQPARLLGIDKYCGTVEAGKMANLLISTKPIFDKDAAVKYMIVEGALYAYETKEKKKPAGKEDSEVVKTLAGTWSYTIEAPDQKREGTFAFIKDGSNWKGTITSTQITSGNATLNDVVVDGNKVSFTYDLDMGGQEVELEFDLNINGDSFDGNVTVGEFGTFPVTGTKSSKPN